MMYRLCFKTAFLFLLHICIETVASDCDIQGYYWRDFLGVIPSDALPGGIDVNRKPIYIGQVLHDTKLIPAKIYENDPKAYYEWGGEKTATQHVKILCTPDITKFEWIERTSRNVNLLTNRIVVDGGYEPRSTTYIGRVFASGETAVGKVLVPNNTPDNATILITRNGERLRFNTFEVLTYNTEPQYDVRIDPRITFP